MSTEYEAREMMKQVKNHWESLRKEELSLFEVGLEIVLSGGEIENEEVKADSPITSQILIQSLNSKDREMWDFLRSKIVGLGGKQKTTILTGMTGG